MRCKACNVMLTNIHEELCIECLLPSSQGIVENDDGTYEFINEAYSVRFDKSMGELTEIEDFLSFLAENGNISIEND